MRRAARWTLRILIGTVAVVLVAAIAAVIFVHTDTGRTVIRDQIRDQLAEVFSGDVMMGRLEGSPFGTLTAHDVVILDSHGHAAIAIERVSLQVELTPLLRQRLSLSHVVAEGVVIDTRREADGTLSLEHLIRPGPATAWMVVVDDLAIRGSIAIATESEPIHFDGVDISASLKANTESISGSAVMRATWRERATPLQATVSASSAGGVIKAPVLIAHVGGTSIHAANLHLDGSKFSGTGVVRAPRAEVLRLARVDSLADITFAFRAHTAGLLDPPVTSVPPDSAPIATKPVEGIAVAPTGSGSSSPLSTSVKDGVKSRAGATRIEIAGAFGESGVRGELDLWVAARRIAGSLTASNVDVALLSRERVPLLADGTIVIDATLGPEKLPSGKAIVSAVARPTGAYRNVPTTNITMTVDSDGKRVRTRTEARNAAAEALLAADLVIDGSRVGLENARVSASSRDLAKATGGLVEVGGRIELVASADGALLPQPALAVTGRLEGRNLRSRDFELDVNSLTVAIDATQLPRRPAGRVELLARGVDRRGEGAFSLRELKLTAAGKPGGAIQASLRARPKQEPWRLDADALIRLGDVVTVDLQRHLVRAGNSADWTGTTGRITIARDRITVRDVASASRDGTILLAGTLHRGARAGDLEAKVDAKRFDLANVDPKIPGRLDAQVEIARRRGRLSGEISFDATGLVPPRAMLAGVSSTAKPPQPKVGARGSVKFDRQGLAVDAKVDAGPVGEVRVKADVATPDVTDVRVWRRLDRTAIRSAQLDLARIDLGLLASAVDAVPGAYGGIVDGQIRIERGVPSGRVKLHRGMAPQLRGAGAVDVDLVFARSASSTDPRNDVDAGLIARLDTFGRVDAKAELRLPDKVFDPTEWRRLDRRVLRRGSVSAHDILIDPARLQQLGIIATARGRVSVDAELVPDRATLTMKVTELRGSPLAQPVTVEARATIDDTKAIANVVVTGGKPVVRVIEAKGEMPVTLAQLIADPRLIRTKTFAATARIPNAPAQTLMGLFGRSEVTGGTVDGTAEVGGTFAAPTATWKVVGTDIRVPPGAGGKPIRTVKRFVVDGSWRDRTGRLAIDASQEGGVLKASAVGSFDKPREAKFELTAKRFDLMPLLVFAPGPVGGAAGQLDANIKIVGADPATATITGEAHLTGARIPIAPEVGTLRSAKIDLVVRGNDLHLAVDGLLGGGTVKASGSIGLAGASTTGGNVKLTLRGVRPIGAVEPSIDADVTIAMKREGRRWLADIGVRNGVVKVPSSGGEPLAPPGAPPDMLFVTGDRITRRPMKEKPPEEPIVIANITLGPTRIESEEVRGIVRGKLQVTADVHNFGITGVIEADRGELDLFGRKYRADRAMVRFDGSTDPMLDISLIHEFPEVVTMTQIRGRVSRPRIELQSNPATYSQGQLLGFLLGGEPSGDPGSGGDRATAAGASYVANRIGGYFRKSLPIDVDVLRYEHATATNSAAITVGTWLKHDLFVAYRRRLESRPDENSGEGEVEYWLWRRVVIEAVVGDRGRNAIDLLWRKRY